MSVKRKCFKLLHNAQLICVSECGLGLETVEKRSLLTSGIAGIAIARLSHRNSVCLSVRPSVTRMDQLKTVQARITKSSPLAAWTTSDELFSRIKIDDFEKR